MPTPSEIAAQRTRRLIIALVTLVVVLAVALAVVVVVATRPSSENEPTAKPSPTPSIDPDGPLKLPEGAETLEGRYPIRFDHTPQGAVAMTSAYMSLDTTLDVDAKAQARALYFSQYEDGQVTEDLENDTEIQVQVELGRMGIDIDQTDLPTQAYMASMPLAAVYEPVDKNTVDVALLTQITANDGVSGERSVLETLEVRCEWDETARDGAGDWVISTEASEITAPEEAEPGTTEFTESEWIELQGGIGR